MRKTILGLAVLMAVSAGALSAQTSQSGTAIINIGTLLQIDVSNLTVTFDAPTFADFDLGYIGANSGSSVIGTRGNVVHDVTIQASTGAMSGPYAKPASDLQWSSDGGSTWTGLSATATDVVTGLARGVNSNVATVDYQMLLNAADVPGTYTLGFTYTVVAN